MLSKCGYEEQSLRERSHHHCKAHNYGNHEVSVTNPSMIDEVRVMSDYNKGLLKFTTILRQKQTCKIGVEKHHKKWYSNGWKWDE